MGILFYNKDEDRSSKFVTPFFGYLSNISIIFITKAIEAFNRFVRAVMIAMVRSLRSSLFFCCLLLHKALYLSEEDVCVATLKNGGISTAYPKSWFDERTIEILKAIKKNGK